MTDLNLPFGPIRCVYGKLAEVPRSDLHAYNIVMFGQPWSQTATYYHPPTLFTTT